MRLPLIISACIFQLTLFAQNNHFIKISGHVIDHDTKTLLDSCRVELASSNGDWRTTRTDPQGYYSFDSVLTYYVINKIVVERNHFVRMSSGQTKNLMTNDTVINIELTKKPSLPDQSKVTPTYYYNDTLQGDRQYFVISLSLKTQILNNNCVINRHLLDKPACLQLCYDTLSGTELNNRETKMDIYFLPLDSIGKSFSFYVEEFGVGFWGDDIWKRQDHDCFTPEILETMKKYTRKDYRYLLLDIKIKDSCSERTFVMPGFRFKIIK
jgi:hypothetical protein